MTPPPVTRESPADPRDYPLPLYAARGERYRLIVPPYHTFRPAPQRPAARRWDVAYLLLAFGLFGLALLLLGLVATQ